MTSSKQPSGRTRVRDAMARLPPSSFIAARPGASESAQISAECLELMLRALELTGEERVLELGSSSGYETALLSRLARDVVSLESDQVKAEERLALLGALGCDNVRLFLGQGSVGWPGEGPYEAILVAGGASRVPTELLDQLAIGGRLVIPLGDASGQVIELVQKNLDGVSSRALGTSHLPMLPWSRRPSFFPWNQEKSE